MLENKTLVRFPLKFDVCTFSSLPNYVFHHFIAFLFDNRNEFRNLYFLNHQWHLFIFLFYYERWGWALHWGVLCHSRLDLTMDAASLILLPNMNLETTWTMILVVIKVTILVVIKATIFSFYDFDYSGASILVFFLITFSILILIFCVFYECVWRWKMREEMKKNPKIVVNPNEFLKISNGFWEILNGFWKMNFVLGMMMRDEDWVFNCWFSGFLIFLVNIMKIIWRWKRKWG